MTRPCAPLLATMLLAALLLAGCAAHGSAHGASAPGTPGHEGPGAGAGQVRGMLAGTTPPPRNAEAATEGGRLLAEANRVRAEHGLGLLAPSAGLDALAREHALAMRSRGRIDHDGFDARFQRSGARRCVENVARNYPDAESVVRAWLGSEGHRRNLLAPGITHAGAVILDGYAVLLGCERPAR